MREEKKIKTKSITNFTPINRKLKLIKVNSAGLYWPRLLLYSFEENITSIAKATKSECKFSEMHHKVRTANTNLMMDSYHLAILVKHFRSLCLRNKIKEKIL